MYEDARLGAEIARYLDVDPPASIDGVSSVVEAIGCSVPTGNTAKIAALAAGQVPPGADLATIVDRWQTEPAASWTCSATGSLRYSSFTAPLLPADIEMFCRISATMSGVSSRPMASIKTPDGMVMAGVDRSGEIAVRRWTAETGEVWGVAPTVERFDEWDSAAAEVVSARRS